MRCAAGRGKAHSAINRLAPSPLPPRVNQEIRSGRNIARSDVAMCAFAWTDPPASRRAPGVESRNFKGRHTSDISPSPNPIRNGPNNLSGLLLSPATFGQRPLDMRPVARDRRRRRSAVFSSRERERGRCNAQADDAKSSSALEDHSECSSGGRAPPFSFRGGSDVSSRGGMSETPWGWEVSGSSPDARFCLRVRFRWNFLISRQECGRIQ